MTKEEDSVTKEHELEIIDNIIKENEEAIVRKEFYLRRVQEDIDFGLHYQLQDALVQRKNTLADMQNEIRMLKAENTKLADRKSKLMEA